MFVLASLAGWVPPLVCGLFFVISNGFDEVDFDTPFLIALCVSGCIGGFISGWLIEPGLPEHRWRLLWLMAGSPALLAWALALGAIVARQEVSTTDALYVAMICVSSVGGSYLGCAVGYRYRLWVEEGKRAPPLTPGDEGPGTAEKGEGEAPLHQSEEREGEETNLERWERRSGVARLVLRVAGASLGGLVMVLYSGVVLWPAGDLISDPYREITFVLFSLLLGGFVSGWIVSPAVRHRRGRFFSIIGASPAFWIWCLIVFSLFFGDTLQARGEGIPVLIAACVVPAAGALAADWLRHRSERGRHEPGRGKGSPGDSESEDPGRLSSGADNQ
jgi:MFS family permease